MLGPSTGKAQTILCNIGDCCYSGTKVQYTYFGCCELPLWCKRLLPGVLWVSVFRYLDWLVRNDVTPTHAQLSVHYREDYEQAGRFTF